MAGLNKVQLIGRLGHDPEVRVTPNGRKVANFNVAVNRVWNNDNGERQVATDWINVEAWGKLGDICEQYLAKGRLIYVEGRIQNDRWEDSKGEMHHRTKVVAQEMQMLERPSGAEEGNSAAEEQ